MVLIGESVFEYYVYGKMSFFREFFLTIISFHIIQKKINLFNFFLLFMIVLFSFTYKTSLKKSLRKQWKIDWESYKCLKRKVSPFLFYLHTYVYINVAFEFLLLSLSLDFYNFENLYLQTRLHNVYTQFVFCCFGFFVFDFFNS